MQILIQNEENMIEVKTFHISSYPTVAGQLDILIYFMSVCTIHLRAI